MSKHLVTMICPWASRAGGGLQSSVRDLALSIRKYSEAEVQIISNKDEFTKEDVKLWEPLRPRLHAYYGSDALRASPGLLLDVARISSGLLQLHGIWMFPSFAVRTLGVLRSLPLIVSPHGMMDPWIMSRGRMKKRAAILVYEAANWRGTSVFRALNTSEADSIRRLAPKARIEIVPNGVNPAPQNDYSAAAAKRKLTDRRNFLFLGRLHEKKSVLELLQAWAVLMADRPSLDIHLTIAGWGDPTYVSAVSAMASKTKNVRFVGPVFGAAKDDLLRNSTDFVLPSHSEGLPMAVLEACGYGLLPLISDECNMTDLTRLGVSVRMQPDPESIKSSIYRALQIERSERLQMADIGYRHIVETYSWEKISNRFNQIHSSLLG